MSTPVIKRRGLDKRVWTKDTIAINILGYVFIGLFALMCLFPFYLIIVASITPEASLIRNGYPLFPTEFSLQSYALCLKNPGECDPGLRQHHHGDAHRHIPVGVAGHHDRLCAVPA